MANANELFLELAKKFPDHKIGKMFGKLCLKNNNGKSCAMVFNDNIVVKLNINDIIKTQELKGVNF
ncbi:MAG: hypothetical protein OEZ25_08945, partial [Candidatus Bathyarchaeota archaeon]|nr:hypothetical protein [Candidatus Bathyarchaeota archaeon]